MPIVKTPPPPLYLIIERVSVSFREFIALAPDPTVLCSTTPDNGMRLQFVHLNGEPKLIDLKRGDQFEIKIL